MDGSRDLLMIEPIFWVELSTMMTGASCGLYLEAFVGLDHLALECLGCTWIPIFVFWTTWSRFFSVGPLGPLVDVLDPIFWLICHVFLRCVCCFPLFNPSVFFLQTFKPQPVGCSVVNVAKSFCSLLLTLELIVLLSIIVICFVNLKSGACTPGVLVSPSYSDYGFLISP